MGGPSRTWGSRVEAAALSRWFEIPAGDEGRDLTHGFHAYPARMHPAIPRAILRDLGHARDIFDPFMGSGTTLIEAALAGRASAGGDINPLAVSLTRLKTNRMEAAELVALVHHARAIGERSRARIKARQKPEHRAGVARTTQDWFAPHVRLELEGLTDELVAEKVPARIRNALRLVLSSILVKVSRQRTDAASGEREEKQIGKGLPTRMFVRKAEELAERLRDFCARVPPSTPAPDARQADARELPWTTGSFDLVITSPPYLGTYDYLEQHALRLAWLGLPSVESPRELGSRRRSTGSDALQKFEGDLGRSLAEMSRVLRPEGVVLMVIGDSAAGASAIYADDLVRRLCERTGLRVAAVASQNRPIFGARERDVFAHGLGKREHLVWLAKR